METVQKKTVSLHPRLTERISDYWHKIKQGRAYPHEQDIDPDALADVWNDCFLIDARIAGTYAYSYLGESLVTAYGDDLTGKEITETLVYPHPEALFRTFSEVVQSTQAQTVEGTFTNAHGLLVKYRCCVLPLGSPNIPGVAYLLGGMRWKIE